MKQTLSRNNDLYETRFGYGERNSMFRFLVFLLCILLFIGGFRIYWTSNFEAVKVVGSSMRTTLTSGDWLLLQKTQAKRGDVIVVDVRGYSEFQYDGGVLVPEKDRTTHLIKRLIAIEGDKVRCTDGVIEICYANTQTWVTLDEPYAYYGTNNSYKNQYDFEEVYEVGEGEIFFLGDNRSAVGSSVDSRYNEGASRLDRLYKEEDIYGVVSQWAIDNCDWLKHFIVSPQELWK